MDLARADALAARNRLATRGWVARKAEWFRHLPPPGGEVWLGEAGSAASCAAPPLAGAGWTLHPVGDGVEARWLDAADPLQRAALFDGVALPGEGDAAPFAWAHRALCRDGLRVRVARTFGAGDTVWLHLERRPREAVEAPLLVVDVEPGVRCVLLETHERDDGCGHELVQNLRVQLTLAEGASLHHLRVVAPGAGDRVAHVVQARLARGASYRQALVAAGCGYHLQRSELELAGAGAAASTAAALFAAGSALEQQVQVAHEAPRTRSAAEALVLAEGRAQAVVAARTRIAPGCDEAEARQKFAGIPTGGRPRLVLKPHLEIHHDQVQASHGATWGALPEDALFYARQRGLDERNARALIVEGLAAAVLQRGLDDPALWDALELDARVGRAVRRHLPLDTEAAHG